MKKTLKKSSYKHGQWFRATISGVKCVGRVSVTSADKVYLCQSQQDGATASNLLGFPYSWCIDSGNRYDLKSNDVKDLKLLSRKPASFVMFKKLPDIGDYSARMLDGETIKVGCTEVSRELYLKVGRIVGWIE